MLEPVRGSHSGPSIHRMFNAAAMGGVLVLAVLQLRYAWFVCQPPPHQDDWTLLASMFDALHEGRLLTWIFRPYNGHFLVAARLAFWANLRIFNLNLSLVRWLCPAVSWASAILWFRWLQRHRFKGESIAGALFGGGLVFFNLSYWENFSLAMGFSAHLAALLEGIALALVAGMFADGKFSRRATLLASASFLCAVLTFGSGYAAVVAVFCWCILLAAGWRPGGRIQIPVSVPWILPVAFGLLLFCSYPGVLPVHLALREFLYRYCLSVGAAAAPVVADSGSPHRELFAFASGLFLICMATRQLLLLPSRKPEDRGYLFGSGLIVCGLVTCFALTYSRMFLPSGELLSSRYAMHFALGMLGLILCLRGRPIAFPLFAVALAAIVLIGSWREWRVAPFRRIVYRHVSESILRLPSLSDDEIQRDFYWAGTAEIRKVTREMEQAKLNVFRNSPASNLKR